jgi:hypothetical protein
MRERRLLQDRPWEEELLHWAKDGSLHGTVSPPTDGRRRSTTTDGWCPGWALQLQRTYLSTILGPQQDEDDGSHRHR